MGFFSGRKDKALTAKNTSDGATTSAPPAGAEQTLSDVVRGMAHAAAAANDIVDQQFIKQLEHFFDVDPVDGKLHAKMVQVTLGPNRMVEVPLVTMIDPALLTLDEVNINMVVKLTETKVAKRVHAAHKEMEVSRSSFGVTLTSAAPDSRSDGLRISMKFKRMPAPEGATRIIDEMSSLISPCSRDGGMAHPSMTQTFGNPSGAQRKEPKVEPPLTETTGEFPPADAQ